MVADVSVDFVVGRHRFVVIVVVGHLFSDEGGGEVGEEDDLGAYFAHFLHHLCKVLVVEVDPA